MDYEDYSSSDASTVPIDPYYCVVGRDACLCCTWKQISCLKLPRQECCSDPLKWRIYWSLSFSPWQFSWRVFGDVVELLFSRGLVITGGWVIGVWWNGVRSSSMMVIGSDDDECGTCEVDPLFTRSTFQGCEVSCDIQTTHSAWPCGLRAVQAKDCVVSWKGEVGKSSNLVITAFLVGRTNVLWRLLFFCDGLRKFLTLAICYL